jgi:hypothetical protein
MKLYLKKILIIIILIFLLFMMISGMIGMNENFENIKKRIVLARYKEDIGYIKGDEFKDYEIWIYNKGDKIEDEDIKKRCNIEELPNVGKCDHTYLYYIINEYDKLPEITIFLPASFYYLNDKKGRVDEMMKELKKNEGKSVLPGYKLHSSVVDSLYSFVLDEWKTTYKQNQDKDEYRLLKSPIRPFGKWYQKYFNNNSCNFIMYGGIFAVSRDDIKKNPKSKYEELMKYVDNHINPEAGHYIERIWGVLFGCN